MAVKDGSTFMRGKYEDGQSAVGEQLLRQDGSGFNSTEDSEVLHPPMTPGYEHRPSLQMLFNYNDNILPLESGVLQCERRVKCWNKEGNESLQFILQSYVDLSDSI